jgi:hypothetical protein
MPDVGLLAGAVAVVEDDRPGVVLGQFALDRPQYLLAPVGVALTRLRLDHLVDLGIAGTVNLAARPLAEAHRGG